MDPSHHQQDSVAPSSATKGNSSPFSGQESAPAPKARKWIEPVAALLMALTTVCTAWCSYQSAAWTRRSNRLMNESNALERRAGVLVVQGAQTATIHVALFAQLLAAQQAGNKKLEAFYLRSFPPDLRKAYDAWMAQNPFENPNAPAHPFIDSLYQARGSSEAAEASSNAQGKINEARKAGNTSGQYLANTVLFATVLFFANAAAKFAQDRVRLLSILFAVGVFLFAAVRTLIFQFG